jgi:hypothetical protein
MARAVRLCNEDFVFCFKDSGPLAVARHSSFKSRYRFRRILSDSSSTIDKFYSSLRPLGAGFFDEKLSAHVRRSTFSINDVHHEKQFT